jgi:rhodanese-related sulfurtransferase
MPLPDSLQLSVTSVADRVLRGDTGDWVLLDVREPWECMLARLPFGLHVPMQEVPDRLDELPSDRAILCLCHHGVRSARVAAWLRSRGHDARNIDGGIDAWSIEVDPAIPRY